MMKRWISFGLVIALFITTNISMACANVTLGDYAAAFGDANRDGGINAQDALVVLQTAVDKYQPDRIQKRVSDVDGDQAIDAKDALLILQYSVKLIDAFAAGNIYDGYTLSDYEYADPNQNYQVYQNSSFGYNTSLSVNGAYATDKTADTSFVMDNTGLLPKTIYLLGKGVFANHDVSRLVYSLQGLINRDFGRDDQHTSILYSMQEASDPNWLNYITEEGSVYAGYNRVQVDSWDGFYATFQKQIQACGLILWDGNVPATSNVAATICGLDGYLPVLAKSRLHNELLAKNISVKQSLVGMFENGKKGSNIADTAVKSTGSAKNDAYRWALEKYFSRCSVNYLAYTLDGAQTIRGYEAYEDNPVSLLRNAGITCLSNHDYLIARRCFFFDLSPSKNEEIRDDIAQIYFVKYPCPHCSHENLYDADELLTYDEPQCANCNQTINIDWDMIIEQSLMASMADQGTDYETMCMIFDRRYQRAKGAMGQLMGFPPWWVKYTSTDNQGLHAATWIEWLFSEILSCYNLAKEADAAQPASMTNGSAYYKYVPLQKEYKNRWDEYDAGVEYSDDVHYFTIYVGDYDSSAWLKTHVNTFWMQSGGDKARANLPLTWCFNPNLSNRVPMVFDYIYANKYDHEFIAAGDSGAGYVIPSSLFGRRNLAYMGSPRPSEYASGDTNWANYCKWYYDRFDIKVTGFIINGANTFLSDIFGLYNTFSTMGSLHNGGGQLMTNYKGVPYIYCQNGINDTTNPEDIYNHAFVLMEDYNFAAYRTVCLSPSQISAIIRNYSDYATGKGDSVQYVELYSFLDLAKQSEKGEKID